MNSILKEKGDEILYVTSELLESIERCIQYIRSNKKSDLKDENIILLLVKKFDFSIKKFEEIYEDSTISLEFRELIGGLVHSISSDIGIIKYTLLEEDENDLRVKKYNRLLRCIKQCEVVLNNLRSILLEGKSAPTEVDMKEVLDDVITLFEYRIPSNVKLITEISSKLPKLIIDKSQIEQVLVNIINNAIGAMSDGGELSVKVKKKRARLNIEISDTGIGIPKENLDNVFKLHFSTKKKGFGLGLYLTKRIIESHNGSVSLKSQEGKGTTISINLPIGEDN